MLKSLSLSFLLCITVIYNTVAQTTDPTASENAAKNDVGNFKLNHDLWQQFKRKQFLPTSDYFNPTPETTSNIAMLKDSTYVYYFRKDAYFKTLHRHSAAHYVLYYGIAAGVIVVIVFAFKKTNAIKEFKQ